MAEPIGSESKAAVAMAVLRRMLKHLEG